LTDFASRNFAE